MKKILFLAMLLIGVAMSMQAQEYTTLVVLMRDGSSTKVQLSEEPKVTFSGTNLNIATTATTLQLDRAKVQRFNYVNDGGVKGVSADNKSTYIKRGDLLIFQDLKSGSKVSVFGVDGRMLKDATASGNYEMSLSELSSGVYIVDVNGTTTKITIRR
ncbi:MAG: T9SS type A sorting domain-containing protein [Muribaculaceae bacterium]|nr:T9SS type A sorting domain-containing protein [Muribaculaceae bacterium]